MLSTSIEKGEHNLNGPYYDAQHDKLCGLATRAIVRTGTFDAFCILMRELNQYEIKKKITILTIQIGNDATYWIPDMERS